METKKSNGIYLGLAFILGMLILGGSLVLMIDNLKSYDRCAEDSEQTVHYIGSNGCGSYPCRW